MAASMSESIGIVIGFVEMVNCNSWNNYHSLPRQPNMYPFTDGWLHDQMPATIQTSSEPCLLEASSVC